MNTEAPFHKTAVSRWLPIAVITLGLIFLLFVVIEYQRNIALVEQNRALISNSAKAALVNQVLSRELDTNWGNIKGNYQWIKNAPYTYWFEDGAQSFPWSRSASSSSTLQTPSWQTVWDEINATPSKSASRPKSTKTAMQGAYLQRFTLLKAVHSALNNGDRRAIQTSFDSYLEHKNAYHLSPQKEVAFSLKLVAIGAKKHWSPELVHAILLTGGSIDKPLFRPVTDILFRHNSLFSVSEFNLISNMVQQHLEALNLPTYYFDEYRRHLDKPQFSLPKSLEHSDSDSLLVTEDNWLLQQASNTHVSAEPFALAQELLIIEDEFIALGVLNQGDSLRPTNFTGSAALNNIDIQVDKAQLNLDRRNQAAYLAIKAIMLIAFITLVLLTLRLIEKNQQRRMEYLNLKEDFVKLVSHELKTPLAGIRAMAETLRKRLERNLGVQSYPERIVSEADKLWYMVDNILGFNRVQFSETIVEQRPTKLRTLCNSVIDDVRSFSDKPYMITNTINEPTNVSVDAELFALVVKNIVVNAGLYNDNKTVELKLTFDENARSLLLADNGVGIADEDRDKVFQPFVRLTQSARQSVRQSGTGLGLAICKRIMLLHNGDLSLAESNNLGSIWKIKFAK